MREKKFKRVTVSLTDEVYALLVELAKKAGESMSSVIRKLIRQESEKDRK